MYAIYFLSQFLKLVKLFSGSARNTEHRNSERSTLEKLFSQLALETELPCKKLVMRLS